MLAASDSGAQAPENAYQTELREMRDEILAMRLELAELKKRLQMVPPGLPDVAGADTGTGEAAVNIHRAEHGRPDFLPSPPRRADVNVYGVLAVHAIHDFNAPAPGDNFTNLGEQLLGQAPHGRTIITPQSSRVGLDAVMGIGGSPVHLKLETDFYAYCKNIPDQSCPRNRLRLRQAYGEYGGLLIGQTWSTFVDLENWPDTLDFNGPNGSPGSRRPMVRYTVGDAAAGYNVALGIESPVADSVSTVQGVHARVPNLVARFDQKLPHGAFNVRLLRHDKIDVATNFRRKGWGIGIGGRVELDKRDVFTAQVSRVDGDADMLAGSNGYVVTANSILFDKNYGVLLGWQHLASRRLQGYVVYGANWSDAGDEFVAAMGENVANRRLDQIQAGVVFSVIPGVEFGAEYIYGERRTFGGQVGKLSRAELMAKYVF